MIYEDSRKTDVFIKKYPTYSLYGRIKEADVEEFKKTKNMDLILYRFCINGQGSLQYSDYQPKKGRARISLRW